MNPPTCHPDRKVHGRGLCGSCYQKYWMRSLPDGGKEIRRKAKERAYSADPEGIKRKRYNEKLRVRLRAVKALGGQCVWCGFNDYRGLEIDHINDDRIVDGKREPKHVYTRRAARGDADLQLLCGTCHLFKTKGFSKEDRLGIDKCGQVW